MLWGLPATSREIDGWTALARKIPDRTLRDDALDSLVNKRDHAEGAALFCVLPARRHRGLLRLLVAYQTMWDFLDNVSERYADATSTRQLHLALVQALDPDAPISDYYRHCRWKDDDGYLQALVRTCRACCTTLPSYALVRSRVLTGVKMCSIQSINHDPDPQRRDDALMAWATQQAHTQTAHTPTAMAWYELAAAASGFIPHPLLALAAEPSCEESEIAEIAGCYFPWLSLAITMLDSYADQAEDAVHGRHSYVSHYRDSDAIVERLCEIVARSARDARRLRSGNRHAIIVACMVAMYLSKDSAYTPTMRPGTLAIAASGGSLTRLLLPIVRIWRAVYLKSASPDPQPVEAGHRLPAARPAFPPGSRLPRPMQTFAIWRSPHTHLERCRCRYGSRFTLNKTSHPPLVFLSDRQDIQAMFAAPADVLHPGEGADTIEPLVGATSFMLSDDDEHLLGRKAILPAFRPRAVQEARDVIAGIVYREVSSWPADTSIALHQRLRGMTLQTILLTALLGARHAASDAADPRLEDLHEGLLRMLSITACPVFPEPLLRLGPGRRRWERFLSERDEVDELIYALVAARERQTGSRDCARGPDAPAGDLLLLDRLMQARNIDGSQASARQVRDNLMSLVLAGHETTASQLAWAFQLLAHNPHIQQRLIEEIDLGVGDAYLTATVQEVLRHRPVFLFAIPRAVKQPIEIGGWTYRPPAQLVGCTYLLHHDPSIYPNPDEFRPERFPEGQPVPYTWMPWGGGRKRCPGSHLAMLEMKTVLRTVLERMTIDPAGPRMERPRWRSVIVTPHAGGRVILRRRERPHIVSRRLAPANASPEEIPPTFTTDVQPAD